MAIRTTKTTTIIAIFFILLVNLIFLLTDFPSNEVYYRLLTINPCKLILGDYTTTHMFLENDPVRFCGKLAINRDEVAVFISIYDSYEALKKRDPIYGIDVNFKNGDFVYTLPYSLKKGQYIAVFKVGRSVYDPMEFEIK